MHSQTTKPPHLIAADQKLFTYEEAGKRIPKASGKGHMSAKYIAARVREGKLISTNLGCHCKRIAELDLLKFLEQSRDLSRRK